MVRKTTIIILMLLSPSMLMAQRLISFEASTEDAYILELGDTYMRFYRNGGIVLSDETGAYAIETVYDNSELFDIQYVQDADVMYLVDGNNPPQNLSRADHDDWTIENMNFETGPFLDENTTETTVEPNALTGTISLIANADIFDSDHVGALWRIGYRRSDTPLTGTLDANESSAAIEVGGTFYYNIQGTWEGDVVFEKSFDDGSTYETVYPRYNASTAINEDFDDSETEDGVLYRVTMENYVSGNAEYYLRPTDNINYGIVRIATYVDANEVTATVLSTLQDANSGTTKWSEGYWSDYRGWPQTIEFYEQRLMFGGSTSYPQTIWASKTASGADDDYVNMTAGVDDDDALIYVLPGQNPIQWMKAQTQLLIGTLAGVGRWGSADDETAITPTNPTNYREQARYGAAYMQAEIVGDAVLYVERGGQRIREFSYDLVRDRYVAPNMTALAEHITGDGIVDIAYQGRPTPILWCVTEGGDLASLTYERSEEVVGWSMQTTEGNYESVATMPGADEDEVWVVVLRDVNDVEVRYIEQFQPRDWGADQEDMFFVDSGLTFDGGAAVNITAATQASPCQLTLSTWPTDIHDVDLEDGDHIKILGVIGMTQLNGNIYTVDDASESAKTLTLDNMIGGTDINSVAYTEYVSAGTAQRFERNFTDADHLDGAIVAVLADGESDGTYSVSADGTVGTVNINTWANVIHAGLPFTSKVKTLPIIIPEPTGISAGKIARIDSIVLDFYKSLGVRYGQSDDLVSPVIFYDLTNDPGDPLPIYTGLIPQPFMFGYARDNVVYLESSEPYPFTLRMMAPNISISER